MGSRRMPYALPRVLQCSAERVENGVTMDLVKKYIRLNEDYVRRYKYLYAMYCGFHDIYREPEKEEWKPDTRLAVGFPKYIVDTFHGYTYGLSPKLKYNGDDRISEQLGSFVKSSHFSDFFYELTRKGEIYGHSWAYLYQDEAGKTRTKVFAPDELFCVYSDTLREKALFAVRYGYKDRNSDDAGELYGELITTDEIRYFEGSKLFEPEPNPYGMLNVVECRFNDERTSIFEGICGMTELYDRTLSEKGNDVESFAEAYLMILGVEVDENDVRRIRDSRVINIFGTDNAEEIKAGLVNFLQKPTADATQENLLDRLERLIFQMAMVANISDESFGNATSGVALGYKLWNTDNLANNFDRKNVKTLQKILKIWASLSTNCADPGMWEDVNIEFLRNVPNNVTDEIANARNAAGVVSKRTQLGLLSFVEDPDAELEAMEQEQSMEMPDIYGDLNG